MLMRRAPPVARGHPGALNPRPVAVEAVPEAVVVDVIYRPCRESSATGEGRRYGHNDDSGKNNDLRHSFVACAVPLGLPRITQLPERRLGLTRAERPKIDPHFVTGRDVFSGGRLVGGVEITEEERVRFARYTGKLILPLRISGFDPGCVKTL